MSKNRAVLRALILALGFMVFTPVNAAMVSYGLTYSNTLPDNADTYVTVTIADGADASLGEVTFTVDVTSTTITPDPTNFGVQKFLFNDEMGFISSAAQFLLPTSWSAESDRQGDGFGRFDWLVSTPISSSGSVNRLDPLIFGITGLVGSFSVSDFISFSTGATGDGNSLFAAHVAGFTFNGSSVTSAWFGIVPIPAAVWLFASGLGLLGWIRHMQRRTATA